ncbi:MAG: iron-sulfur cluster repair di-iron protein [Bacteroidia bacterium]|nr:iron-sulfur cluster repair di-iron protein [Bacteroidia bacterium]
MEANTQNILNVTLLEPRQKHPTIFARFDELKNGEVLTIHNDHDPKPLYYQMLGERGNTFTWEYLESGPEWWKIKITKRALAENQDTLGQIAAKDLRKAQVFKKYGLDFCCGGNKTIKEACAEQGIDPEIVEKELTQVDSITTSRSLPYNDWSLDFLADYIVNTHHAYVRKNLPDIRAYAQKVMTVHGSHHPELIQVQYLVDQTNAELTTHMGKEEQILFPFIKELVARKNNPEGQRQSFLDSAKGPIRMMEVEHDMVGNFLKDIRTVTHNYLIPQDACGSYKMLYKMLEDFEEDLHIHIHLENNILFPKTMELEKSLTN